MPLISYEGVAAVTIGQALGDTVFIDIAKGVRGMSPLVGTAGKPSNNFTDAVSIANTLNLRKFHVRGGFALPDNLPSSSVLIGSNIETDLVSLGANDFSNFEFDLLAIVGTTGTPGSTGAAFRQCLFDVADCRIDVGEWHDCQFKALKLTTQGGRLYRPQFYRTYISYTTSGVEALSIFGGRGTLTLQDMTAAFGQADIFGNGLVLTIDSSCTTGTVNIYGDVKVINNGGGVTVNDYTATTDSQFVEEHFHNAERAFGLSADQSGNNWGTIEKLTPFLVTAGTSQAFGAAIKVIGPADTPVFAGSKLFDIRRINVTNTSSANDYMIRLIWGTGSQTSAQAIAAGQFTSIAYARASAAGGSNPIDLMFKDIPVGSSVWAQCSCVTNGGTISFYAIVHEHPTS